MASTSSLSIQKSFKYDVFLSFRGEDTGKNFVDHLYHVLEQRSIHTYMDAVRIKKGKEISDELIKSIEESKFHIIVFSKNYASSSWCLDELVKIMECHKKKIGQIAYPVFYDVEPSEVRRQTGAVGEAFSKHEKKEAAEKWRGALKEAADVAGWELKNIANAHEAKFIKKIVEDISLELRSVNFGVDGKLVGMKTRVNNIVSSLEIGSDDVRIIGIKGIGGGGKTTLARSVFDQISTDFEAISFVENVREVSKTSMSGLKELQKQILLNVINEHFSFSSVYDGTNVMKKRMRGRKVLIVLDDVDHINQLEALADEPSWFKPGSRVIVTTRDEQVLVAHGVSLIHDVNLLSHEEAVCLFSRHAFGREFPIQGFEELSRNVVGYAAGLPLTIRVLGSFLCGKSDIEWRDALERLKTIPLKETLDKLELSYITLEKDYKEIFLDVACLLKGWHKDAAIRVLESCGFHARIGLRVLEQKSLITISYKNCLGMHDHIEEMGKNIVPRLHPNEPTKHSRLWIDEEINDILLNNLGSEATQCIKPLSLNLTPLIVMKGLGNMKELRYLDVRCGRSHKNQRLPYKVPNDFNQYLVNGRLWPEIQDEYIHFLPNEVIRDSSDEDYQDLPNEVIQYLPNALRFLCWKAYPFWCLPKTFRANNLVGLEMSNSRIKQLWEGGERKVFNKLRFLDLCGSDLRTFDLGMTPNLETLNLKRCRHLIELHMASGCLNLISLDLSYTKLRTLDLAAIPNLERLDLESCYHLVEINAPVGCLKRLIYLDLSGCGRFKYFVFDKQFQSLGVGSLSEMHLIAESVHMCPLHYNNNSLPTIQFTFFYKQHPASWYGNLEKLISFGLCACTDLQKFSVSICSLKFLRKLTLEGTILEVPNDLHQLECLEELVLTLTEIKNLPDSICMLKNLRYLKLKSCRLLEKLPEDFSQLQCLEELTVWCEEIKQLPESLCLLKNLKSFKLKFFWHLEKLPDDFGQLESLEELVLLSTKITHLPDSVCMLKHLKYLKLKSCWGLENLPDDFGQLESLEKLVLSSLKIDYLPDGIYMLKCLKSLKLKFDWVLEDLGRLEFLKALVISFSEIKRLPDSIFMINHLKSLKLSSCDRLEELPEELERLECLEKLILKSCRFLRNIPNNIWKMKQLKYFHLQNCIRVDNLPDEIGRLEFLKELNIEGTGISHLPQSTFQLKGLRVAGSYSHLLSFGFNVKIQRFRDIACFYV